MNVLKVFFLILLLGGNYGLVPASLEAFPQATVGCDGRANLLFAPTCPSLLLQREYSGISSVLVGLVLEVRLIRDMTDLGKPIHCILQEKYGFRFRSSDTLAI